MSFPIENRYSLVTKASCAVKSVLEISFAINKYALSHLAREKLSGLFKNVRPARPQPSLSAERTLST